MGRKHNSPKRTYSLEELTLKYVNDKRGRSMITKYRQSLRHLALFRPTSKSAHCKVDESGLLSFITYTWVFTFLWSAFRNLIDKDQVWQCSIYESATVNIVRLEHLWHQEQANNREPRLFRAVFRLVRTRLLVACLVFVFCLLFGFIGPTLLVRGLLSHTETSGPLSAGLLWAVSLLFVELARVLSYGATWAVSYRTGIRARAALLALVYKRQLGARSLGDKTAAEIVNVYANDGQRIFDAITFAPLVLMGSLVLIAGIIYLCIVIGPCSLLGILTFVIFDVIQYGLGKTMIRCRNTAIDKTEKRVSLMGQILRCIRIIKMSCWEEAFAARIRDLRHEEKTLIKVAGYAQSLAIASGPVVPIAATMVTFLALVLAGNDLLASDAFSTITVFFVMLFGIRMIPYGSRYLAEASVALRRIQQLIQVRQLEGKYPFPKDQDVAISMINASLSWEDEVAEKTNEDEPLKMEETSLILHDINLTVEKKKIIGICGPVGSGKSSLLQTIIGHLVHREGDICVEGTVSFVSQTPWIQNMTIRENILFGEEMDNDRYQKVLHACGLIQDLKAMSASDQTQIGERGATLSGGQKARVSLARSVYSVRDLCLLDDVFASIDRSVARHIFANAIKGLLKDKTVLFVSSDPMYLQFCDSVVYMESGRIFAQGPHEKIKNDCEKYRKFCEDADGSKMRAQIIENVLDKVENDQDTLNGDRPSLLKTGPLDEHCCNSVLQFGSEKIQIVQNPITASDSLFDIPSAIQDGRGQIIDVEEDLGLATISCDIYKKYIQASGGYLLFLLLMLTFLVNIGASIFCTIWLSYWIKSGHQPVSVIVENRTVTMPGNLATSEDTGFFAVIYSVSMLVLFASGLFKAMVFVKVSLNAGSRLHNRMLAKVLKASMKFFDSTPSGRILNRFSRDMDEIDAKLPLTAEIFLQNMLICLAYLVVIAWIFPIFLLASVPIFLVFLLFVTCFRAGIRSLKRSENVSRSPLFDHISGSLDGIATIHAFDRNDVFLDRLKTLLDVNSGSMFMFQSAMRWLAVWLDLLVVVITFLVSLFVVFTTGSIEPAYAGMALAFTIQMSGTFQFAVRSMTDLEAKMTSVERICHYIENIEQEHDCNVENKSLPADWSKSGGITFNNVVLKYDANACAALNGVSFAVGPTERVGIVGRTGSGKTSLGNALFRLYPLSQGSLIVGNVDVSSVTLHQLRSSMAVIPQDPSLFAGSIRFNLDPGGQFNDEQLWTALERTYSKELVSSMDEKLDSQIAEDGKNLSVGQRQLLSLTRALLRNVHIVLVDEATASLDGGLDKQIGSCIRKQFRHCTVLVIAHRLDNLVLSDKILFMDGGKAIEFEAPSVLLQNDKSRYSKMITETYENGPK